MNLFAPLTVTRTPRPRHSVSKTRRSFCPGLTFRLLITRSVNFTGPFSSSVCFGIGRCLELRTRCGPGRKVRSGSAWRCVSPLHKRPDGQEQGNVGLMSMKVGERRARSSGCSSDRPAARPQASHKSDFQYIGIRRAEKLSAFRHRRESEFALADYAALIRPTATRPETMNARGAPLTSTLSPLAGRGSPKAKPRTVRGY